MHVFKQENINPELLTEATLSDVVKERHEQQ